MDNTVTSIIRQIGRKLLLLDDNPRLRVKDQQLIDEMINEDIVELQSLVSNLKSLNIKKIDKLL